METIRPSKTLCKQAECHQKDRRNAEEAKANPVPQRYEEDQHKRMPKPPVEEQPRPVDVSIALPEPLMTMMTTVKITRSKWMTK
jgi:hypothetical protein